VTRKLHFFYRCPNPIYFSLEKLFREIEEQISHKHSPEFSLEEVIMPYPSQPGKLLSNLLFARRRQGAINHITGDIHYIMLAFSRRRINILTIHDCVMLRQYSPKSLKFRFLKWLWYDFPVKKADMVTVISEQTKRDLLHFTRCEADKIKVISDFVDPGFRPQPYTFRQDKPRILFIGSTPNKNLQRLIGAMEGLRATLDIVGRLTEEQKEHLDRSGIDYEQSAGLSPEAIIGKYASCDLLAFPSTYEGFGLPIVEAQATGRPVLTSNIHPMQEVAGEGACLVDPYDVASIRQGLERIINGSDYRKELIDAGFRNVARFQPDKIMEEYVALYRRLIEDSNK
jgi:glycosyltransferase involved in cell wall biosynthesis